jgi:hypothetical protein
MLFLDTAIREQKLHERQITEFIKHHYGHFNAAALIDAAERYKRHFDIGGKIMITLAREQENRFAQFFAGEILARN